MLDTGIKITNTALYATVEVWKGREASHEPPLCYHRPPLLVSLADIIVCSAQLRFKHARSFAMPDDPAQWQSQSLTQALHRTLHSLHIRPFPHGKFTRYVLRIGVHIEQVLLGILLEIRMACFRWKHNGASMALLYFNRTINVSAASHWFFGNYAEIPAADSNPAVGWPPGPP